ncbi:MAG: hypothetical protein HQM06_16690 [Magnetococcales bacterium]|nr:hypothetical protein [Magnetococcales bacterium]
MPITTLKIPFAYRNGGIIITARASFGPEYEVKTVGIADHYLFRVHVRITYTNQTKVTRPVTVRYRYYNVDSSKQMQLSPGQTHDLLEFAGQEPPVFPKPIATPATDESPWYNPCLVSSADRAEEMVVSLVDNSTWIDHPTPAQITNALNWQSHLTIAISNGPSISLPLEIPRQRWSESNQLREELSDLSEYDRQMQSQEWGDGIVEYPAEVTLAAPQLAQSPQQRRGDDPNSWWEVPQVFDRLKMKLTLKKPLFPPIKDDLGAGFASVAPFNESSRQMSTISVPLSDLFKVKGMNVDLSYPSQVTLSSLDGTRKLVLNFNPPAIG